ncbi:HTH-type transcriptional activator RhaR [Paenibacillus solanacearum]|uniref:HTH-type transcriptional activator RhaR n=1 Tax=Paenibacillus solanacearum TaxID=2048548 RepID=A0A916NJ32_9BACL|nr:AraC family transcriptional regulator [Paenibacillus solanacearum]CAG7622033.1 HTH-type transcriptional activator RhaR [Paenibacillus solanacearum]
MAQHLLSDYVPTITYYAYWERKEKFLMYEDIYSDWALLAIEEGIIYYEIEGRKGTATFGDVLLCPPRVKLYRVVVEPVSFHFIRLTWEHEKDDSSDPSKLLSGGKMTLKNTERLAANYACLRSIPSVTALAQSNRKNHYVRDLWYTFCSEEEPAETAPVLHRGRKPDTLMKLAEKRIRHNAYESFELRVIAEELEVSPAQLTKRFKSCFGLTPTEYLTHLRLEKARSLLLGSLLTLDQIAQCVGYENGFYLSRLFAKHFHMPPNEYRKKHRM